MFPAKFYVRISTEIANLRCMQELDANRNTCFFTFAINLLLTQNNHTYTLNCSQLSLFPDTNYLKINRNRRDICGEDRSFIFLAFFKIIVFVKIFAN